MDTRRCYNCMSELSETVKICPECGFDNSTYVQPDEALPCGTVLHDRYLIGKMIGRGGFAITYIGFDYTLETPVCVKEFFPDGGAMRGQDGRSRVHWSAGTTGTILKQGLETFVKEAKKAARVRSLDSVVNVWDVFYENDTAYIVMEYIKGVTLKEYLMKRGTLMDTEECLRLMLPVIRDLKEVHKNGIVHRDISPDNLMIRENGKVMLLDLGAAKDLLKGKEQSSMLVYKSGFSPLEQYTEGTSIGPWTDVYAMCATIYWCMTGKNVPDAMDRMLGEEPEYPESMPETMKAALEHGLKVKPSDRIQDMEELEKELEAELAKKDSPVNSEKPIKNPEQQSKDSEKKHRDSKEPQETREKPKKPHSKYAVAGLALIAAVVIAIFGFGLFSTGGSSGDLQKKAEKGDAAAQNELGLAYYEGDGVEQDYETAVLWFEKSAGQGYAEGQDNLGDCYYYGKGVEQDYEKAVQWYAKAAEQGHAKAQNDLGYCCQEGKGVPQNYIKAVVWYMKAAEQGYASAQNNLGYCYQNGRGVLQDQKKAVEWYTKAAEQGYAGAQSNLGYCYSHGEGVPQDYEKAVEWYTKAAEQGYAAAQYNLGYCYENGEGVPQDYEKAVEWYTKAAEQGDEDAGKKVAELKAKE